MAHAGLSLQVDSGAENQNYWSLLNFSCPDPPLLVVMYVAATLRWEK